jgi:hypothetical protein
VLEGLGGFDWDTGNIGHIAAHDVTPVEVEEATARPYVIVPAKAVKGEPRWKLFGTTEATRYLVVVYTIRDNKFRAVTAYTMNEAERRKYAAESDNA